ncbi:integrase [Mycetocola sp. CAN_C7]|uniref:tyrosine-type recombinase/integrase n=1 Tax=Mycetocola sp. CAN_C7 TaxID=2787724 RepID=UPI0018CABD1D
MASVTAYETASGKRYRVRYRKPDHAQTDKRGFKTKREAELFLASVEVSKARGEFIDVSAARATVGSLGPRWLASQTHLKPSSFQPVADAWRLRVQPRWGTHQVSAIRHTEIQEWVSELSNERSATVVIRTYGVLSAILESAVKDRRILSNPAKDIDLPRKPKRKHVYLSHQEVHTLADNSRDHSLVVLLLAYTGLRWGELAGLTVSSVDVARGRLKVSQNAVEVAGVIHVGTPKNHKVRSVPFPSFLIPQLLEQMDCKAGDDLLLPGQDGEHMKRTRVSSGSKSWFKTALVASKLEPMTLHDLRHTAASLAISSGANVKAVQRMLGHASATMTLDTYADLFDDDLDSVSARLDEVVRNTIVGKVWARADS